jgi:hypothetical protein
MHGLCQACPSWIHPSNSGLHTFDFSRRPGSSFVLFPQVTTLFRDPVRINRPENALVGVMYFTQFSGNGFPFTCESYPGLLTTRTCPCTQIYMLSLRPCRDDPGDASTLGMGWASALNSCNPLDLIPMPVSPVPVQPNQRGRQLLHRCGHQPRRKHGLPRGHQYNRQSRRVRGGSQLGQRVGARCIGWRVLTLSVTCRGLLLVSWEVCRKFVTPCCLGGSFWMFQCFAGYRVSAIPG